MRTESVYEIMKDCIRNSYGRDFKDEFKKKILGTTVMTDYNNKTYKIDDVDFNSTPADVFVGKNGEISFMDYYRMVS